MNHAHLCIFKGERSSTTAEPGERCNLGVCRKPAAGYGVFPWGAAALCAKHLDEECGPKEKS